MKIVCDQAIILAGGLGTRLRGVVSDRPKSMALIHNRPFLSYQFDYLLEQGIRRIVLSTGYMGESIESYFGNTYHDLSIQYVKEKEPMGTGGGLLLASQELSGNTFMMNGDSLFSIPLKELEDAKYQYHPSVVIALRKVEDAGRYGQVEINDKNRIMAFREKNPGAGEGSINGGIYLMEAEWLKKCAPAEKFSLEREIFAAKATQEFFMGIAFNNYFIDIGIPEDYRRACDEFPD
ncbi:MAG TPA: nucleotidyltransferase family protein [Bacteroidales bacterium]|nr:nucleotidyltransferase family protein [Bacteroidales bacterium]